MLSDRNVGFQLASYIGHFERFLIGVLVHQCLKAMHDGFQTLLLLK